MQSPPQNWCFEADEELVRYLTENTNSIEIYHGNAKKYVEKVEVSTVSTLICDQVLFLCYCGVCIDGSSMLQQFILRQ